MPTSPQDPYLTPGFTVQQAYTAPTSTFFQPDGSVDLADLSANAVAGLNATYASIGRGLAGGMTFAATGDSITAANTDQTNNSHGDSWATHCALSSGGSLRLIRNAAHGGYTSTQLLALLQSEVLAYSPAVVGIMWGTNDTLDGSNKPTVTAANTRAAMAQIRATGAFPFLCTIPPAGTAAISAPAAPTLTASTTGGTVAAGTYYYAATYTNGVGETTIGASASVTTTGTTSSVAVDVPYIEGPTGAKVYVSTDNTAWHLIGTLTGSGQGKYGQRYTDATASVAGASAPGANGTGIALNATANLKIATINAWIREYGRANGIPVVDQYPILVEPTTGTYKTGYTQDGTHPTTARQKRMGDNAWTTIKPYIPQGQPLLTYSQSDALNLYTNGCFQTGNATNPSGYGIYGGSATGVSTANVPKTGFAGNAFTVTRTVPDVRFCDGPSATTGFSAGDTIAVGLMLQIAGAEAGGGSVSIRVKTAGSNATPVQMVLNAVDTGPLPWAATFTVPPGTTGIYLAAPYVSSGPVSASLGQVTFYNVTTGGLLA